MKNEITIGMRGSFVQTPWARVCAVTSDKRLKGDIDQGMRGGAIHSRGTELEKYRENLRKITNVKPKVPNGGVSYGGEIRRPH